MKMWQKLLGVVSLLCLFSACGEKKVNEPKETNKVAGELTVVTDRPDAKQVFKKMEAAFIKKYPDVKKINWESTGTDYDQYITTRMNTKEYGDVVFIPFSMAGTPQNYPKYFTSLGTVTRMKQAYLDVTEADYKNQVYGLPTVLNSLGIIYNEALFKKAGITQLPVTSTEFVQVAKQLKEKTGAIPFYTNYKRLAVWAGALSSYGGEDFKAATLKKKTAFQKGQPIREVMDLLHRLAAEGLIEPDPVTLETQQAQQQLADGKIAMLMSGSQDVAPIQAVTKNKEKIRIMPFPVKFTDKTSLALGAPSVIGINKNSKNKKTARAFLDFFLSPESGFADYMGGMTPITKKLDSAQQQLVKENNVILTAPEATTKVETTYSAIANEVGIARLTDVLQKVVNIGLYPEQNESYQKYVDSLEEKWTQAAKNHE